MAGCSHGPRRGGQHALPPFWNGLEGFEPDTSRTLRFFFETTATFVDVGANYGFYSLLAALWNQVLRVVAFEPVPQMESLDYTPY